tara:strand:- start:735 stop:1565 length:831 start_codon:yes stop_codon:yes gene_type:complete
MLKLIKKELDELDEANWYEGPEYYKFNGFDPNKKPTEDPDKELELLRSMIDGGLGEGYRTGNGFARVSNRIQYPPDFFCEQIHRIACILKTHYEAEEVRPHCVFYYPPNAECYWNTNSDNPGKHIYLTWAEKDNESFFKYYDNITDKIVTKYEKKGWNINEFDIPEDGFFWHYIATKNTKRKSIGFIIVPKNEDIHMPSIYEGNGFKQMIFRVVLKGEDKNKTIDDDNLSKRFILADNEFLARKRARAKFPSDEFDIYRIKQLESTTITEELVTNN